MPERLAGYMSRLRHSPHGVPLVQSPPPSPISPQGPVFPDPLPEEQELFDRGASSSNDETRDLGEEWCELSREGLQLRDTEEGEDVKLRQPSVPAPVEPPGQPRQEQPEQLERGPRMVGEFTLRCSFPVQPDVPEYIEEGAESDTSDHDR